MNDPEDLPDSDGTETPAMNGMVEAILWALLLVVFAFWIWSLVLVMGALAG